MMDTGVLFCLPGSLPADFVLKPTSTLGNPSDSYEHLMDAFLHGHDLQAKRYCPTQAWAKGIMEISSTRDSLMRRLTKHVDKKRNHWQVWTGMTQAAQLC